MFLKFMASIYLFISIEMRSGASGRHPDEGTGYVASDGYHKYEVCFFFFNFS